MTNTSKQLITTQQHPARLENQLARIKLQKRKQDTRNKIQLGGLVIKSKLSEYSKTVILGALVDAYEQLQREPEVEKVFRVKGERDFRVGGNYNAKTTRLI